MAEEDRTLSEDEAWEIAVQDHPDWRRAIQKNTLPDEIPGPDGQPMNPRMHLLIHSIIERQLANDEPEGVAEVGQQLEELGVSRHDVRHEIGYVVAGQLFQVMKHKELFDEAAYMAELRELVESYR